MSYFTPQKRINLSASAISSSATQAIGATLVNVTVWSGVTQIASSIGYPSISISSGLVTLPIGWKYVLDVKMKTSNATASTAFNYLTFYAVNTSDVQISSTGIIKTYSDASAYVSQEKCIFYIDATASSFQFRVKAKATGSTNQTINASADAEAAAMRSHILIKAWQ
jgi:hypothetical protein